MIESCSANANSAKMQNRMPASGRWTGLISMVYGSGNPDSLRRAGKYAIAAFGGRAV